MILYKKSIYDLYTKNEAKFYEKNNIINVVGVLEHKIKNLYDLSDILEKNKLHRKQGISSHNKTSSRSHAIYKITFIYNNEINTIQFIDLAGTERASNARIWNVNQNFI